MKIVEQGTSFQGGKDRYKDRLKRDADKNAEIKKQTKEGQQRREKKPRVPKETTNG